MRKSNHARASVIAGSILLAGAAALLPGDAWAQQTGLSYSEDIVPIFNGWCTSCHQPEGEGYKASGLDLTSYAGLMKGTKFGPMVIPGKPDESSLVVLIMGRGGITMPLRHKELPVCLRQSIWKWIFQGAKDN